MSATAAEETRKAPPRTAPTFTDRILSIWAHHDLPKTNQLLARAGVWTDAAWSDAGDARCRGKWHGYRLRLDLSHYHQRASYFYGRLLDMPTQLLIRAALRPGETVVDGGAHVGMVSLLAAHAVGPTGRVLAFEPNPEIYKRLRWHVEENKLAQVTTFPFALSNEAGSAVLQVPTTGNTGAATLGQLVPRQQGPNVRQFAIETRVGDELFPSLALPDAPMFIKLDVEGHELHLLQGLASVLERRKPSIVLECNVEMLPQNGASADALFRFLEGLGYEAFWLGARWSRFKRRYRLRMGRARPGWRPAKLANVFFMHPDSRSRGRMSSYIEQGPPIMDSPIRVADLPSLPAA